MIISSTNNFFLLVDIITMDDETWLAMSKYTEPKNFTRIFFDYLTRVHSGEPGDPDRGIEIRRDRVSEDVVVLSCKISLSSFISLSLVLNEYKGKEVKGNDKLRWYN